MNRLLVFAKYPEAGKVKTRLCPPLEPVQAAALYRAMMLDSVDQYRALGAVQVRLQIEPPSRRSAFEALFPGLALDDQQGEDLGRRMAFAFESTFKAGTTAALVIGTDHPILDPALILEAFDTLAQGRADMVIGPTEDGGYYLLGLRRRIPALFEGIAWSSPEVYRQTLQKAQGMGLKIHALPSCYDVDTAAELDRLKKDLKGDPSRAPRVALALGL